MSHRPFRYLPAILLAVVVLPLWGLPARSFSPYLDQVRALYPYDFSCSVCHDANHQLNPFGRDFAAALARTNDPYSALRAIEALDSDHDGVSNGEELRAGTLPEDRFSVVGGYKGPGPSAVAGTSDAPASAQATAGASDAPATPTAAGHPAPPPPSTVDAPAAIGPSPATTK